MSDVSTAVLDPTETYRYHLARVWGEGPRLLLNMINPSKADASVNDPTVVRGIGFAKREGFGGLEIVNMYALRATDPKEVPRHRSPIGPDNDRVIAETVDRVIADGGIVVAAWGPKPFARERIGYVVRTLLKPRTKLWCLGVAKDGSPRHPLMVKLDQPLIPWPVAS